MESRLCKALKRFAGEPADLLEERRLKVVRLNDEVTAFQAWTIITSDNLTVWQSKHWTFLSVHFSAKIWRFERFLKVKICVFGRPRWRSRWAVRVRAPSCGIRRGAGASPFCGNASWTTWSWATANVRRSKKLFKNISKKNENDKKISKQHALNGYLPYLTILFWVQCPIDIVSQEAWTRRFDCKRSWSQTSEKLCQMKRNFPMSKRSLEKLIFLGWRIKMDIPMQLKLRRRFMF